MIVLLVIAIIVFLIILFLAVKTIQVNRGKKAAEKEYNQLQCSRISPFSTVKKLSILPLVDFFTDIEGLKTEAGVSYLIKADENTILMDVGLNEKGLHPSPLLHNMQALGVNEKDIDMIYFSHIHMDHVGGMEDIKNGTFSISQGLVDNINATVYAPDNVSPSKWNPSLKVEVIKEPRVLKPGIASIGSIPRFLFMLGHVLEQSLAINVEGKGIVLVIGCGHQTIERIIERAQKLFDEPIYGIIGGLHFPVKGGRIMAGPVNVQHLIGSDNPPWSGVNKEDVKNSIESIKKVNPKIVALSPHDSSDWSVQQFKNAFGDKYFDIKVGKEIII